MHSTYLGNRCYLIWCKFFESFKVNMVSRKVKYSRQISVEEPAVYAVRKKMPFRVSYFGYRIL